MYTINVFQTDALMTVTDCKRTVPWEQLFYSNDEWFRKAVEEKFLYIFQYGRVGFFNLYNGSKKEVFKEIRRLGNEFNTDNNAKELNIVVPKYDKEISFNKMAFSDFDVVALRKVLHTIILSVALEKYAKTTDVLWTIITLQNNNLKENGKLSISHKILKKHIGTTFSLKNKIAEKNFIFNSLVNDSFENTDCNNLDLELKNTFSLRKRLLKTNRRLAIIQENLELFKAILDQKESSRLEWIIILLIAIEIVDLFVLRFLKWII